MTDAAAALDELLAACVADAGRLPAARAAARRLHAEARLATPAMRVTAATLLVGGDDVADVELAHTLALAALAAAPAARPLAAVAFDRLRVLAARPQKFGTQWRRLDGALEPCPIDPATTDSERAKWGLPALAELLRAPDVVAGIVGVALPRWPHGHPAADR